MIDKEKALAEINVVKVGLKQLQQELTDLEDYINQSEGRLYWYHCTQRATVKTRVHMLRKDLIKMIKMLYS